MKLGTFFLCVLMVFTLGCKKGKEASLEVSEEKREKLSLVASIYPYKLLAKEVGGERLDVSLLISGNLSPHFYAPKMSDLKMLEQADVFLLNGGRLEGSLETILPSLKNVLAVSDLYLVEDETHHEAHHHDECVHSPHYWFSPEAMKVCALALAETLALLDESSAEYFRGNAQRFVEELEATVLALKEQRENYPKDFAYLAMHNSYDYFCDFMKIEVETIEEAPGREPSTKTVAALIEVIEEKGIRFIVLDPQTEGRSAKRLAENGELKQVIIDPLGLEYQSFLDYYRITWKMLAEAYDSH